MKKETYFNILLIIFVISIVIANVVGARVITTGITLGCIELATSGGAVTYAFTFLCTDIISELWGKKKAMQVIKYGLIGQVFALTMIVATGLFKAVDSVMDGAYCTLFTQNAYFVAGSLLAYYCSQTWDVWIFHDLKGWYLKRRGVSAESYDGAGRWIWNNCSTGTSQVIDTLIYATVSFGIGMRWFFQDGMMGLFFGICIGQYVLKLILALLDTPPFYLLTSRWLTSKVVDDEGRN